MIMLFSHHNEPYGTVTFAVDSVRDYTEDDLLPEDTWSRHYDHNRWVRSLINGGYKKLTGVVVEGGVVSRLFQYTSFRSKVGERYSLTVSPHEFVQGYRRTIAC